MKNYKQLTQAQRYQIEILKKAGKSEKRDSEVAGGIRIHVRLKSSLITKEIINRLSST